MAIEFPIPAAEFFNGLSYIHQSFELGENLEGGGQTGRGEVLSYSIGERLWQGSISVSSNTPRGQERLKSRLDLLRGGAGSFMIGHVDFKYPEFDPDGSILGASGVTVHSVESNNRELRLRGAPVGYIVSDADHISITHAGTHSYYRVVSGSTFLGSGASTQTGLIEVQPFIHDLVEEGAQVRLVRPALKAVYVPGSYKPGARVAGRAQGFSFSWKQTYL